MTEKFDKRAGKTAAYRPAAQADIPMTGMIFLTEFRSDGDIAVRSLEDLGLDDDFALSELQNSGGRLRFYGTYFPIRQVKIRSRKVLCRSAGRAPPEEDLDLSIFDELDVLLDEEKESPSQKA